MRVRFGFPANTPLEQAAFLQLLAALCSCNGVVDPLCWPDAEQIVGLHR